MKMIPREHIQRVHQTLCKRKKDLVGPNLSQGSNPMLGVHTNKLNLPKKNPRDDKSIGCKYNLQLLQEIGDILVNFGQNALITYTYQPSPSPNFQ